MDLLVGVTEYDVGERRFTGLCSGFLRNLPRNSIVPVWLKKGTLDFPKDRPLLLIATGTGISAFRAAIHALHTQQKIILLYGFRDENDYYLSELEATSIEMHTGNVLDLITPALVEKIKADYNIRVCSRHLK